MIKFKILIFLLLNLLVTYAKISDRRLCANDKCTEPISQAKTLLLYNSPEHGVLSFRQNADVTIFSKSAGTNEDLWGVEINGKRGYAPKNLLRETIIFRKDLNYLLPTEIQDVINTTKEEKIDENPKPAGKIEPKPVVAPYEVIDGTTIHLNPEVTPNPAPSNEPVEQSQPALESTIFTPTLSISPDAKVVQQNINTAQTQESKTDQKEQVTKTENIDEQKKITENEPTSPGADKTNEVPNIAENLNKIEENLESDSAEDDDDEDDGEEEEIDIDAEDDEDIPDVSEIRNNKPSSEQNEIDDQNAKQNNIINKNTVDIISEPKITSDSVNNISQEQKQVPDITSEVKEEIKNPVDNSNIAQTNKEKETQNTEQVKQNEVKQDVKTPSEKIVLEKKVEENNEKVEEIKNNITETIPLQQNIENFQKSAPPLQVNIEQPLIPPLQTNEIIEEPIVQPLQATPENVNINENLIEKVKENIIKTQEKLTENSVPQKESETSEKVPENSQIPPIHEEYTTESTLAADIPLPILTEITENPLDPITQPLTEAPNSVLEENENPYQKIEQINPYHQKEETEQLEKKESEDFTETSPKGTEPGLFSKIYTGIFGDEANLSKETKDLPSDIEKNEQNIEILNEVNTKTEEQLEVKTEEINLKPQNVEIDPTQQMFSSPHHPSEENPLKNEDVKNTFEKHTHEQPFDKYLKPENPSSLEMETCDNENSCSFQEQYTEAVTEALIGEMDETSWLPLDLSESTYNVLLFLSLTAITVLVFCLGHYYIEKRRIDSTLISNINELEKKLLVTSKESLLFQDELKLTKERLTSIEDSSFGSDEMVTTLKQELDDAKNTRIELEEQISNLEKELENATEAGLELNRMLADFLSAQNGNESIMENVEHLQKQLFEQQSTINNMNATLNTKNMDNELLQTELSVANNKIEELKVELDKMVVNLLSVQEEKCKNETEFKEETRLLRQEFEEKIKLINSELVIIKEENNKLREKSESLKRALELKTNEYSVLKESMNELKVVNTNKESLAALLDVSKIKAEVQQLREEKHALTEKLHSEKESKLVTEKQVQVVMQEMQILKDKYEEADRDKVEAQTRLDVLSTYFNDRETQLQKELNERESLWVQKQGEATSTVERIKYIQEELQNYKSQNELLKKEILDQEVSLKSQISVLEKKSHDNWVLARQAERKLEDAKQESSQLRNRLTLVEKNLNNTSQLDDSKLQNRVLQPIEANGDMAVSPLHMSSVEAPGSPPLLFQPRDHMTTSPALPGLPPFMPPPPGVPFMPPPPGVPPFMPPLPGMFPGDHRPPPLGRMSSPPVHGRYSPDSRAYSPYERDDSPPMSPAYGDSEYRRDRSPPPPPHRAFSPYAPTGRPQWDDMRDYRDRPQRTIKHRNHKGAGLSSGSGNSNESLENSGRHSGRV